MINSLSCFVGCRSQPSYSMDTSFLPDPASRYRHLLFTTLRFCLAVLTSLGVENMEAGTQVIVHITVPYVLNRSMEKNAQKKAIITTLNRTKMMTFVDKVSIIHRLSNKRMVQENGSRCILTLNSSLSREYKLKNWYV